MRRFVVTGGRDYEDWLTLARVFKALDERYDSCEVVLIHGAARGADTLAAMAARILGWTVIEFPADWKKHGRSAGAIRNRQMITEGRPDKCIAFPGGRGTGDMMTACRAAGVPCLVVGRSTV